MYLAPLSAPADNQYFVKDKKYTRNPKESSYCPEATVGLIRGQLVVHRTSPKQEAQEYEILLLPEILQLRSTTPIYNSALQPHVTNHHWISAYHSSLQLRSTTTFYQEGLHQQKPE